MEVQALEEVLAMAETTAEVTGEEVSAVIITEEKEASDVIIIIIIIEDTEEGALEDLG